MLCVFSGQFANRNINSYLYELAYRKTAILYFTSLAILVSKKCSEDLKFPWKALLSYKCYLFLQEP